MHVTLIFVLNLWVKLDDITSLKVSDIISYSGALLQGLQRTAQMVVPVQLMKVTTALVF